MPQQRGNDKGYPIPDQRTGDKGYPVPQRSNDKGYPIPPQYPYQPVPPSYRDSNPNIATQRMGPHHTYPGQQIVNYDNIERDEFRDYLSQYGANAPATNFLQPSYDTD